MARFQQGESILWPSSGGWRIVLAVNDDGTYYLSPMYDAVGTLVVGATTLSHDFVDAEYSLAREPQVVREEVVRQDVITAWHMQDLAVINEELAGEADERDWCSAYDAFVDRVNRRLHHAALEPREHDIDVRVTYTVTVSGTVTARYGSEDDAAAEFYNNIAEPSDLDAGYATWRHEATEWEGA
jgi:hypothetical protein